MNRAKIRADIDRIRQRLRPGGACPACADRAGRVALVIGGEADDGTFTPDPLHPAPAPCPACGQVPEQILHVTERIREATHADPVS
jgi:hypothetical protein